MMGGDANIDQDINSLDKTVWGANAGNISGYEYFDFDMNNIIDNQDKNEIWQGNNGQSTQVPE